jgi:hypothetical protein
MIFARRAMNARRTTTAERPALSLLLAHSTPVSGGIFHSEMASDLFSEANAGRFFRARPLP